MADDSLERWMAFRPVRSVVDFFTKKIWNADFKALRFLKRGGYSFCRLMVVAVRGVVDDRCTLQSSALTYITMVSLVPVLAIALSFCKGMGFQQQLLGHLGIETLVQMDPATGEEQILYRVVPKEPTTEKKSASAAVPEAAATAAADGVAAPAPVSEAVPESASPVSVEVSPYPANRVRPGFAAELPEPVQDGILKVITYVDKTNFAALGIVGVLTLLCTVVMSIQKLESSFNDIWCVQRGRTLLRQFSEYLVVLLLMPILLSAVLSLNSFINSGALAAMLHTSSPVVAWMGQALAKLILVLCLVLAFAALYFFLPNTRVDVGPALLSGAVAGIVWGAVLLVYIHWQIGLARYNAIYGAFASLPFFLAWLYASWMVVLLGAELCYAAQNQRLLRQTKRMLPVEAGANHLLGIAIVEDISRCYREGKGFWNAGEFAMAHNVSIRELEFCLESLTRAGLVLQRQPEADPPESYDYVLSRPAEQITLAQVSDAILGCNTEDAERISQCMPKPLVNYLQKHYREMEEKFSAVTFQAELSEPEKK